MRIEILLVTTIIFFGGAPAMADESDKKAVTTPCPGSPNCVSSMDDDPGRRVAPIAFSGPAEEARERLLEILTTMDRVKIVRAEKDWIHAQFRSLIFRFVDDVHFYFPPGEDMIHVKSESRSGYYDFGVNRRRVESIREKFETWKP